MIDFYIACGVMFLLLAWVGYRSLTDPDGLNDPNQRVAELEKKVQELERRLAASEAKS